MDLSELEYLLVLLVSVTGVIHLYQGLMTGFQQLTLAGIGFLAGLAIFLRGYHREDLVLLTLPFTGYQIFAYYSFYGLNFGPIAAIDKIVQLILLVSATAYLLKKDYLSVLRDRLNGRAGI